MKSDTKYKIMVKSSKVMNLVVHQKHIYNFY